MRILSQVDSPPLPSFDHFSCDDEDYASELKALAAASSGEECDAIVERLPNAILLRVPLVRIAATDPAKPLSFSFAVEVKFSVESGVAAEGAVALRVPIHITLADE